MHQIFLVGPPLKPGYAGLPGLHMSPPRLCCCLLSCPWLPLRTRLFQVLGDVVTHLSLGSPWCRSTVHRQSTDSRCSEMILKSKQLIPRSSLHPASPCSTIAQRRQHLWLPYLTPRYTKTTSGRHSLNNHFEAESNSNNTFSCVQMHRSFQ